MHTIIVSVLLLVLLLQVESFLPKSSLCRIQSLQKHHNSPLIVNREFNVIQANGISLLNQRNKPLRDILGLGPAELGIILVVGLVLFGPETLKSLSKDVGRAAAELKEIPKTFKEGMDEGAQATQLEKMKALAAEKRKKRDEKLASQVDDEVDEE